MNDAPSRLDDLIGQARPVTVLKNAIRRGRVAHAYLFHGPEGVGKSTAARLFAQALNCERIEESGDGDACGECRSCLLAARGSHPDVRMVTLEPDEKGRLRTEIAIEQVRQLIHDAHLKRVLGRNKVYIIDPADRMNQASANALLKVVEEPPGQVVLILVTSQLASLLPTILSRSQKVAFQIAGTQAIERRLRSRGVDETTARLLAALSGGRPAWALRAVREPGLLEARRHLLDLCAEMDRLPLGASLRVAERIREEAEQVASLVPAVSSQAQGGGESEGGGLTPDRALRAALPWCLEVMASWYRDRMAVATGGEILNRDFAEALNRQTGAGTVEQAGAAIEWILETRRRLVGNANLDLALEALATRLLEGAG